MKVLAFEDSVDIEALLISGGIELSNFEFKQTGIRKITSREFLNSLQTF